ncbi:hypothetical protein HDV02_001129 [Globomyces sp. JEL0801]|nr:hypothetical protein HDV02_001563 [Globomyces sp. JEL0801]KAJ2995003.1 hypothetical protein HDV02_001129 [Globomyces sp. JEL0801]
MSDDITNMLKDLLETETMLQGDSVLHHAHDLSSLSSNRSNPKTGMAPSEALPKSTELVRNLSNPTLHRRLSEPYVDQNNKLDDLVKRSLSNINSNTFATEKSVSFVDDMNSPLVDIVSFDEQDPPQQLLENSISTVSLSKTTPGSSILKSNSQTIIPDVLPLKPDDYNSDSGESDSMSSDGSESDTSSSTSDVRSPYELQNEDEDIEVTVDEEPEPSQQNSFFDNVEVDDTESVFEAVTVDDYADFDGLLDVLDDYIKLHPQSAIPSGEAFSPLPPNVQNHMLKLSISNERGPPVYPIQTMLSNPGINRLPSHQPRPERKKSRSNRSSLTIPTPNNPSHRKPSITLPDGSDDDDDDNTPLGVSSSASNSATNSAVRTTLPDGSDDDDVPLEIKVKAMNSAAIENKLTASSSDLAKQEKRKLIMEKLKEANITKAITGKYPRTQGYLYLELTPGTWSKRFCVLRDYKLVYYADGNSERMWSVANANQTPNVENAPLSPQPLVSAANLLPVTPGSLLATVSYTE